VCAARNAMAYSPLGGASSTLLRDPTLVQIGAAHGCSPAAVALAWTIRSGKVIAIPESGNVAHVTENAAALSLALTSEELHALDAAHPPAGSFARSSASFDNVLIERVKRALVYGSKRGTAAMVRTVGLLYL